MSAQLSVNRYSKSQSPGLGRFSQGDTYNLTKTKLIEAIDQKSIAGIISITAGSTEVLGIFHPMCNRDVHGTVTHIIGNPLDKQTEFGLIKTDIQSYRALLIIGEDTMIPPSITPNEKIDVAHLLGTKFEHMTNIVGGTMTNLAVLPFHCPENLIGFDIHDNNLMNSPAINSITSEWLLLAKHYSEHQDDIDAIVLKVLCHDEDSNRTKYFDPTHTDPNAIRLGLALNGLSCTMTAASSDNYEPIAKVIRAFYTNASSLPPLQSQNDNSTTQLVHALSKVIAPDEQGDKEKARMGSTILSLLASQGNINFDTKTIIDLTLSTNATGYDYALKSSLKNRSEAFTQLYNKHFFNARGLNPMDVRSFGIKNIHLDKSTSTKFLAGDFSMISLSEIQSSGTFTDSITVAQFLPMPVTAPTSNVGALTPKQTFFKSMIARVTSMKDLDDIKTLLVHIMTFLGILVVDVEKTILHQMMNRILFLIHKPTFSDWFDKYGEDFIYSALRAIEQMFVYVSKYASDLNNVNSIILSLPNVNPPTLDSTHLTSALAVLHTFETNVDNAIANESALPSQSGVALSYKAMAGKVKDTIPPTKPNTAESKQPNDNSRNRKANDSLPPGGARANSKVSRRSIVDTSPPERKPAIELGIFIPATGIAKNKIMPPSITIDGKEVCMDFACVGFACPHTFYKCTRAHATKPSDFVVDDIHKIAKHFIDNSIGKFNAAPFRGFTLPDDLKSVISG